MKPVLYSVLPRPPHPTRDGLAIRNYHLLAALAEQFRVRCLALRPPHLKGAGDYPPGVEAEEIPQARRTVRRAAAALSTVLTPAAFPELLYRSSLLVARLSAAIAKEKPAWIVAHSYHMAPAVLAAGPTSWVDFHNVDSEIWRRLAEGAFSAARPVLRWQAARVKRLEEEILRRAAGVSCVSPPDSERLARAGSPSPFVVPNGVDLERYAFREEPASEDLVFFVGDLTWAPNLEGIRWFCRRVWPLLRHLCPSAQAIILGRGSGDTLRELSGEEAEGVSFPGEGGDTRPFWKRAAVAVVPLRSGGGTRLKILEAAASGVPVVSTTIGAEGLDLAPGREILLADGPEQFAAAVLGLLADPAAGRRQAAAARKRVEEAYDWKRIGQSFAEELAARAGRASP